MFSFVKNIFIVFALLSCEIMASDIKKKEPYLFVMHYLFHHNIKSIKEPKPNINKIKDADLKNIIREKYSFLYQDESVINTLDIKKIKDNYNSLVTRDEGTIGSRFYLDTNKLYEIFRFDRDLVKKYIVNREISFIKPFDFVYKMTNTKTGKDVEYTISIENFCYLIPMVGKCDSDIFTYLVHKDIGGDITFTDDIGYVHECLKSILYERK